MWHLPCSPCVLSEKPSKRQPCLHEQTFAGQRTASSYSCERPAEIRESEEKEYVGNYCDLENGL